ncbi:glycosyltransferase family 2 protein [Azospirillum rugosum]|uniref:Glycosyltransferase involved in cell wall biosynthesis n=1 Tax=Azospirillum rugosum TaxID=416170 RepID=A0ABS4SLT5_9PROT|nr:glycosyltransferase family 2 protein [Azospirillum rugosum]MBP2293194.1 glycosyltransferase involved in cell wall biosynthesis [Azospirillum rugosum]MDQ0526743.1 glycosyltransferase involved in cell wall biosynthesis [Azospirillum rugosum]
MSLSDAPSLVAPAVPGDAPPATMTHDPKPGDPKPGRGRRARRPRLSVVIPFYNEGANVDALFDRLVPVLDRLDAEWEVVCVNDGSRDDTLDRLLDVHDRDPRVKVVDLSRNFGKELALSAGLGHVTGDAVVPMDADLQHPPELLPQFLAKWREGYDVVVAVRNARVGQSFKHRMFARAFYWIFDNLSEVKLPREVGDFRLMDRRVVEVINRMPERTRFMKGIFAWVGFRQASIPYEQGERAGGETKWGFLKLLRLSFDGLTAFSTFPLRVWSLVGMAVSGFAFVYIVIRVIRTLLHGIDVPGYESLLAAVLFLGGVQLITLGILGDYLGRVFNEVKGRPLYIVRSAHGFEDEEAAAAPAAFRTPRRGAGTEDRRP